MTTKRFLGAVISEGNEDLPAIMELLAHRIRDEIEYVRYSTAKEIEFDKQFNFLVLGTIDVIRAVVKRYQDVGKELPLIIHLVYTREVRVFNYYQHFPGVNIAPIRQAPLDRPDTTLQLDLFEKIIAVLREEV